MMTLKACLVVLLAAQGVEGFSVGRSTAARRSALYMTTADNKAKRDVKVGVIGCGRIGLVHLEATTKAPGVTPIIVSNPTISKAEAGKQ